MWEKIENKNLSFSHRKQSKRIKYEAIREFGVFDIPKCASAKSKIATKFFPTHKALRSFIDELNHIPLELAKTQTNSGSE